MGGSFRNHPGHQCRCEPKIRQVREQIGVRQGLEYAGMDELGVDEGDEEAFGVEEFGQFEHGLDVALCWERDTNGMGLDHLSVVAYSVHFLLCLCLGWPFDSVGDLMRFVYVFI